MSALYIFACVGRSFRTMSIDLYTVTDSRISRSYHVENWTAALRRLAND